MFNNKRKQRDKMMQMAQQFTPTSKAALKQFCIAATNGDLQKAKDLYNFYIEGMEDLPMFDPVPPTMMEKVKGTADGIFGFIRENQDGIIQGVELIRGLMGKGKTVETAASPLTPIN